MARTLLTVMAAAALLCLVRGAATSPRSTVQSSESAPTTTTGPQIFNLEKMVGKWRTYYRNSDGWLDNNFEMKIVKKTRAEIVALKEQFLSQNQTHQLADISWDNIYLYVEIHFNGQNETFLIEAMTDPSYIKLIHSEGQAVVTRIQLTDEKMTLSHVNGNGSELKLYRTLPDLATFAGCDGFDDLDASDAVDADFLVGTWTPSEYPGESSNYLRVSKKTTEEVAAYRADLRYTIIEEADIDWTKVRVEVEVIRENSSWAHALIEFLDKLGFIRVIPLRDTWDRFDMADNDWFRSQNFIIKNNDGLLAIKNCHKREQEAYLSRRPDTRGE